LKYPVSEKGGNKYEFCRHVLRGRYIQFDIPGVKLYRVFLYQPENGHGVHVLAAVCRRLAVIFHILYIPDIRRCIRCRVYNRYQDIHLYILPGDHNQHVCGVEKKKVISAVPEIEL